MCFEKFNLQYLQQLPFIHWENRTKYDLENINTFTCNVLLRLNIKAKDFFILPSQRKIGFPDVT